MLKMFQSMSLPYKLVLLAGLVIFLYASVMGAILLISKQGQRQGKAEVRAEAAEQALNNVQEANNARNTIGNRSAQQHHADCVRWARNPADCGPAPK